MHSQTEGGGGGRERNKTSRNPLPPIDYSAVHYEYIDERVYAFVIFTLGSRINENNA